MTPWTDTFHRILLFHGRDASGTMNGKYGGSPSRARRRRRARTSYVVVVVKQRLEPVVVHDAAGTAGLLRDAVGAHLEPTRHFGMDRGAVDNPLHHGVEVCQDLRVNPGRFAFGSANIYFLHYIT
jgi:hypothetical protein